MTALYTEHRGDPAKPALVLLHGWGMNSTVWDTVLPSLEPHFSITLIDLPGLGRSPALDTPTLDATVEALLTAAPPRACWLGWSLGGQLALAAAARAPERINSLILVASNPCFVSRPDWSCAMDSAVYDGFRTALEDNPAKTLTRFAMLQTQGAEAGRETLKMLRQLIASDQPAALAETLRLLENDTRPALATLQQPLLMQFGTEDQLVPVAAAEGCRNINSQAQTRLYEGAGHLPFISHRDLWCDEVIRFVTGVAV